MHASYRIQLGPGFTFADLEQLLPYLERLGISHLYLSPITEARPGSSHGYDVIDHNAVRSDLGGRDGFDRLRKAALRHGLSLIFDIVPNHAGVGSHNLYWQDVLAYGPHSAYSHYFDIDWHPIKPELHGKILLPFLGDPYGEVLDRGELKLNVDDGRFYATYYENRYALNPATYTRILSSMLPHYERTSEYWDLKDLADAYAALGRDEREKAEGLRVRLVSVLESVDAEALLRSIAGPELHALLERQFWRLSYWKTASYEINYRRFFNINELVALRMEDERVFWDAHRLMGELLALEGVEGLRVDHVDGLFDPHVYLKRLRDLGAGRVWVEKILAHGETLPDAWPVDGSTGYEFMNDAMGVLLQPSGEISLDKAYRRAVARAGSFENVAYRSRILVMETSLSSELFRLSYELDRISEADYHTRDFTLEALREALREIVAVFDRYRTYLPYDLAGAREVIQQAVHLARQRNPATEPSVYSFIASVVLGDVRADLRDVQQAWVARFQQYTAPVAAKGVEDTAFYRYYRLSALNEVGGEPDRFGLPVQAFHAHARFRAHRYPLNLVATATHDHKRGEDTRMRLIALAELPDQWERTVRQLQPIAEDHRGPSGPGDYDVYLFFQTLAALWEPPPQLAGEDAAYRQDLPRRLQEYMLKASRESKRRTSWLNPDEDYEQALEHFVSGMMEDERTPRALEETARAVTRLGFLNSLSQTVLKLTTPGIPDFYQGCELFDLSLVDPDNRGDVDYDLRRSMLEALEPMLDRPALESLAQMIEEEDARAKLYLVATLLRLRRERPAVFAGGYQPLDAEGGPSDHWISYARTAGEDAVIVLVSRFPASRASARSARITLPSEWHGSAWQDVFTGLRLDPAAELNTGDLPLPWAVLERTV